MFAVPPSKAAKMAVCHCFRSLPEPIRQIFLPLLPVPSRLRVVILFWVFCFHWTASWKTQTERSWALLWALSRYVGLHLYFGPLKHQDASVFLLLINGRHCPVVKSRKCFWQISVGWHFSVFTSQQRHYITQKTKPVVISKQCQYYTVSTAACYLQCSYSLWGIMCLLLAFAAFGALLCINSHSEFYRRQPI